MAQTPPNSMIRLTVSLESPEVPAQSFAAKPKVMYRAGTGYCRTEELPDRENGIHALLIVNEPDAWMVNPLTGTAQHIVDPGPTFNCRLPVFQSPEADAAAGIEGPLQDLEFGRELIYFKARGSAPKPGPVLRGKPTRVYSWMVRDSTLFLYTAGTPESP